VRTTADRRPASAADRRPRPRPRLRFGGAVLAVAFALGCGPRSVQPAATPGGPAAAWVTVYDPARAWNGYTLTLHQGRIPALLDMNGRPVHSWPEARIKSRVRLLPDGSLLGIGLGRQVVEYDWDGRQTWEFRTPGAIPHHDVIRLANGNTLILVLKEGESADTLFEVDRSRRVVWTWRAAEHLGDLADMANIANIAGVRPEHPGDETHINSLQELPENPWYAAGDRRFRPGNLLVSARNLDTVFVVDRPSGAVVWRFSEGLDRQHEARMNGPGLPGPGRILIFNNRLRSFWSDRQSEILEIDPRSGAVAWRYRSPGFYTPTSGLEQPLPNGNVLVTSTRGGRVFEVTRGGRLVWEWVPPYEPVRAVRVAADFCPQLARLPAPARRAVVAPRGYRYVDPESYRFARQGSRMAAVVGGEKRTVLKEETDCRNLLLPAAARVQVGYGVDRDRLRAAGRAERPPAFALRLRPAGTKEEVLLLSDTVGLAGSAWRERTIPLERYGLQAVELCVEIDGGAPRPGRRRDRFAYWEQPYIVTARDVSRAARAAQGEGDDDAVRAPGDLTPEEQEVRRQHLKALGYIN
jgi:arylsulfotransferase ASST